MNNCPSIPDSQAVPDSSLERSQEEESAGNVVPDPSISPANSAAAFSDMKRKLRSLLTVPERDRSDAQWDEIIDLEIQLAPGNRISTPSNPHQNQNAAQKPQFQKRGGYLMKGSGPRTKRRNPKPPQQ